MLLLGESSVNMIGDRGTLVEGKSAENVTWTNDDVVGESVTGSRWREQS